MPKSSVNASLSSYDDIFSTEESRQEEQREQVRQIPIGELFPFKNHPFKVLDDDSMSDTVESVKQYGVLSPLIARPRPKGGYEIISGHRRQHAAELAGLETLPVIVRQMDDDAAIILMVDSNLQREHILPSERAFAYKMKLDAMKNQGTRSDLTSTQVVSKLRSNEKLGAENNQSRETVRRFIRLTNLMEQEKNTLTVLEIAPGQYPKQVEIDPDLKALQQAVGGSIGASYPFADDPVAIIYNDDGKLMGLPLNRALRDEDGQMYDAVAGTFLVVGLGEEDFASLTPEMAQKYERLFHQPEDFIRLGHRMMVVRVPDEAVCPEESKTTLPKDAGFDR